MSRIFPCRVCEQSHHDGYAGSPSLGDALHPLYNPSQGLFSMFFLLLLLRSDFEART